MMFTLMEVIILTLNQYFKKKNSPPVLTSVVWLILCRPLEEATLTEACFLLISASSGAAVSGNCCQVHLTSSDLIPKAVSGSRFQLKTWYWTQGQDLTPRVMYGKRTKIVHTVSVLNHLFMKFVFGSFCTKFSEQVLDSCKPSKNLVGDRCRF